MKPWADCTQAEQIERWQQVVRVLSGLPPHEKRRHFNMEHWGERTDCGTVACAAGHCGLDPWFRRRGFKMGFRSSLDWDYDLNCRVRRWHTHIDDAREFFGYEGAQSIFYNTLRRPVTQVIRECRKYIRELKAGARTYGYR